jgi:hypothetical protein
MELDKAPMVGDLAMELLAPKPPQPLPDAEATAVLKERPD